MSVRHVRVAPDSAAVPAAPEPYAASTSVPAAAAADEHTHDLLSTAAHQAVWYQEVIEVVTLCAVAVLLLWLACDVWVIACYYHRRWRLRAPATRAAAAAGGGGGSVWPGWWWRRRQVHL